MEPSENLSIWSGKCSLPLTPTLTLTALQGRREVQHLFLSLEGAAGRGCKQKRLQADRAVSPPTVPHGDCPASPSLGCRNPLGPRSFWRK